MDHGPLISNIDHYKLQQKKPLAKPKSHQSITPTTPFLTMQTLKSVHIALHVKDVFF